MASPCSGLGIDGFRGVKFGTNLKPCSPKGGVSCHSYLSRRRATGFFSRLPMEMASSNTTAGSVYLRKMSSCGGASTTSLLNYRFFGKQEFLRDWCVCAGHERSWQTQSAAGPHPRRARHAASVGQVQRSLHAGSCVSAIPGVPVEERGELASALAAVGRFGEAAFEFDRLADTLGDGLGDEYRHSAHRLRARMN